MVTYFFKKTDNDTVVLIRVLLSVCTVNLKHKDRGSFNHSIKIRFYLEKIIAELGKIIALNILNVITL